LEEAEGADRVCIINEGSIVALGTPQQVKKDLLADYEGTPTLEDAYIKVIGEEYAGA
jgi:ABC-type multidrug transport system ATPase subunit